MCISCINLVQVTDSQKNEPGLLFQVTKNGYHLTSCEANVKLVGHLHPTPMGHHPQKLITTIVIITVGNRKSLQEAQILHQILQPFL